MADRSIVVRLMAEVGGFTKGMTQAGQAARQFEGTVTDSAGKTAGAQERGFARMMKAARDNEAAFQRVGGVMMGVGAATAAALTGSSCPHAPR